MPARASSNGVDGEFHLVPLRLEVGVRPVAWKSVDLETMLVGGVDFVSLEPQTTLTYVRVENTRHRAQPVVGAAVVGRFRLSWSADFVLTAGVDFDAAPRRWVIESPNGRDALFETARVRPYAALGLDFAMLGATAPPAGEGVR